MDSAPNPLARGATVYSLSDSRLGREAARFAEAENANPARDQRACRQRPFLLSDLALRDQMEESAALATRLVKTRAGMLLRPNRTSSPPSTSAPLGSAGRAVRGRLHQQCRRRGDPDHARGRKPIVEALARAIETDLSLAHGRDAFRTESNR
jgi:N-acetylmuramoyl-L-alanine amidase